MQKKSLLNKLVQVETSRIYTIVIAGPPHSFLSRISESLGWAGICALRNTPIHLWTPWSWEAGGKAIAEPGGKEGWPRQPPGSSCRLTTSVLGSWLLSLALVMDHLTFSEPSLQRCVILTGASPHLPCRSQVPCFSWQNVSFSTFRSPAALRKSRLIVWTGSSGEGAHSWCAQQSAAGMTRSPHAVCQGGTSELRPGLLGRSAASRLRKGTLQAADGPDPAWDCAEQGGRSGKQPFPFEPEISSNFSAVTSAPSAASLCYFLCFCSHVLRLPLVLLPLPVIHPPHPTPPHTSTQHQSQFPSPILFHFSLGF